MLGLISLNYKIAPVKIRELFYIYPEEYQKIFNEINERVTLKGLFIISTCNRTEIYFVGKKGIIYEVFKEVLKILDIKN